MHGALTRHVSYLKFPRSPLGTPGTMNTFWSAHTKKKETIAFLESLSAKQARLKSKHPQEYSTVEAVVSEKLLARKSCFM